MIKWLLLKLESSSKLGVWALSETVISRVFAQRWSLNGLYGPSNTLTFSLAWKLEKWPQSWVSQNISAKTLIIFAWGRWYNYSLEVHIVFCVDWRGFVLSQFRARYCGHTLSRLAEIRHNRTKQSRFPTTRREEESEELESIRIPAL